MASVGNFTVSEEKQLTLPMLPEETNEVDLKSSFRSFGVENVFQFRQSEQLPTRSPKMVRE